jgi:hypothetical protein
MRRKADVIAASLDRAAPEFDIAERCATRNEF